MRFVPAGAVYLVAVPRRTLSLHRANFRSAECERVLFGFHCRKLGLNITYRRSESLQGILKAINTDLMNLNFTKKIGTLLLAIYLIVIGLKPQKNSDGDEDLVASHCLVPVTARSISWVSLASAASLIGPVI